MGNCQAAEAAAVLIQHPGGGRTERAYWALSAGAVMAANPGHYVAAVIATTPLAAAVGDAASASAPVKHLKLLRPDDTLLLGRVYRLVSFEEVLREFASKRHAKLSSVTIRAKDEDEAEAKPTAKHRRRRRASSDRPSGGGGERKDYDRSLAKVMRQTEEVEPEPEPEPVASPSGTGTEHGGQTDAVAADLDAELEALVPHAVLVGRRVARQWRPALQSIAEG